MGEERGFVGEMKQMNYILDVLSLRHLRET